MQMSFVNGNVSSYQCFSTVTNVILYIVVHIYVNIDHVMQLTNDREHC